MLDVVVSQDLDDMIGSVMRALVAKVTRGKFGIATFCRDLLCHDGLKMAR